MRAFQGRDLVVQVLDDGFAFEGRRYRSLSAIATHAFAAFREERAVPFLASSLKDDRKGPRAQAVYALGKIGTPDALAAV